METDSLSLNKKLSQKKIILGSFPTWTLTTPDKTKGETEEEKSAERRKNGDLPFYYGSSTNVFWNWYSAFVDDLVHPTDLIAIKNSLEKNKIGITNVITSAKRKEKSSFDYDLYDRTYNFNFFIYPRVEENLRILCTSKAVLNEMLFAKGFFEKHPSISKDIDETSNLRKCIINGINETHGEMNQPICQALKVNGGGTIECVSIPSPGSPFRGLQYFGKPKEMQSKLFLRSYLKNVFSWFISS